MTTYYMSALTLIPQYFTNGGLVASGGTVTTYQGGTVSTPAVTYSDNTGAFANPTTVTLNSAGRPVSGAGAPIAFWTLSGVTIKAVFTDALGETWTIDNIPSINDPL